MERDVVGSAKKTGTALVDCRLIVPPLEPAASETFSAAESLSVKTKLRDGTSNSSMISSVAALNCEMATGSTSPTPLVITIVP